MQNINSVHCTDYTTEFLVLCRTVSKRGEAIYNMASRLIMELPGIFFTPDMFTSLTQYFPNRFGLERTSGHYNGGVVNRGKCIFSLEP